jgi:hypothetical protein
MLVLGKLERDALLRAREFRDRPPRLATILLGGRVLGVLVRLGFLLGALWILVGVTRPERQEAVGLICIGVALGVMTSLLAQARFVVRIVPLSNAITDWDAVDRLLADVAPNIAQPPFETGNPFQA